MSTKGQLFQKSKIHKRAAVGKRIQISGEGVIANGAKDISKDQNDSGCYTNANIE